MISSPGQIETLDRLTQKYVYWNCKGRGVYLLRTCLLQYTREQIVLGPQITNDKKRKTNISIFALFWLGPYLSGAKIFARWSTLERCKHKDPKRKQRRSLLVSILITDLICTKVKSFMDRVIVLRYSFNTQLGQMINCKWDQILTHFWWFETKNDIV